MARQSTVLGLARLQRKLDRLPTIAKSRIRTAMEAQATTIVEMMRSLAPEDSGALRRSIGWTWGKAPKGSMVLGMVKARLGADLTLTIYAGDSDAFYARFQEFGTVNMPANPFFYVSWRANRRGARNALRKAVRQAAREVAGS